jgi:heme ABC exporter ATP-binding subunit CcmA
MPQEVSLTVTGVRKSYGARRVLHEVSFSVVPGEVVAITGANGSGKSTLLKVVAGLLRPSKGEIILTVDGKSSHEPADRRRAVGYAAPDLSLYPELTGRENLRFFDRVRGIAAPEDDYEELLRSVGLSGRGDDPVGAYSSGMRQRMRLAFATMSAPPLLLLDEPSLALDEKGVALVGEMIATQRARGGVTLLATNDAREVALGDRAFGLGA